MEVVEMLSFKKSSLIAATAAAALSTAMLGSYCVYKLITTPRYKDPNKLIEQVKTYFMKTAGSYILNEPVIYTKDGIQYEAYQGGITTSRNHTFKNYDIYLDAKKGNVLDIIELS